MAREKKTSENALTNDAEGFDVSPSAQNQSPPPPTLDDAEETEDTEDKGALPPVPAIETPEQRTLMREKRVAKAEEEQLRRLTRQFPVVARLLLENQTLKRQVEKKR